MRLAVIPARGGSKGLPGKNIRMLNGKPLIAWSIEAALESTVTDRVVVSTDSEEIGRVAEEWGCEVSVRPAELATDESTTIEVLQHLYNVIPGVESMILLQPTSPLRDTGLIDICFKIYQDGDFTNLATGYWCKYKEFGSHNNLRRQDYQGFFYDDGNIYVLSKGIIKEGIWCGTNPCKLPIERHMNYEIDDEVDFIILESLMKHYK
jgi:CMP-N-acetylneuraminic acid synthetase